ncbi:MAG: hypothetical protein IIT60_00450 [Muribaculaceae bacterium]|nr:hypothetical protein [Muribaculaceae bacterium]
MKKINQTQIKDKRFDTSELTSSTIIMLIVGTAAFIMSFSCLLNPNDHGEILTIPLSALAPYAICRILIRIWKQLRILNSYKEWEIYQLTQNKEQNEML